MSLKNFFSGLFGSKAGNADGKKSADTANTNTHALADKLAQDLLTLTVAQRRQEADGVVSFELVHANGQPLPPFTAGSHIDLHLGNGLTRHYSLSNHPGETRCYVIGVLRDPKSRGGSVWVHDNLQVGSTIVTSKPRNHFPLHAEAKKTLLIGGGIGITPVLSMAHTLAEHKADFHLHYTARSSSSAGFKETIGQTSFADKTTLYFDDGQGASPVDLKQVIGQGEAGKHLYVCGPGGLIDAVCDIADAQGWADEHVHFERFAPVAVAAPSDGEKAFDVEIPRLNITVHVPLDKTILAAFTEAGLSIPFSCAEGVCGTCMTKVISGIPDHRDSFLSKKERESNTVFLPCCSRSKTDKIVIDI